MITLELSTSKGWTVDVELAQDAALEFLKQWSEGQNMETVKALKTIAGNVVYVRPDDIEMIVQRGVLDEPA